jgi:hypothetical protein
VLCLLWARINIAEGDHERAVADTHDGLASPHPWPDTFASQIFSSVWRRSATMVVIPTRRSASGRRTCDAGAPRTVRFKVRRRLSGICVRVTEERGRSRVRHDMGSRRRDVTRGGRRLRTARSWRTQAADHRLGITTPTELDVVRPSPRAYRTRRSPTGFSSHRAPAVASAHVQQARVDLSRAVAQEAARHSRSIDATPPS